MWCTLSRGAGRLALHAACVHDGSSTSSLPAVPTLLCGEAVGSEAGSTETMGLLSSSKNSDGLGDVLMVSRGAVLALAMAISASALHSRWVSTMSSAFTSATLSVVGSGTGMLAPTGKYRCMRLCAGASCGRCASTLLMRWGIATVSARLVTGRAAALRAQPALEQARSFLPVLSQRLARGMCRVGEQQLLCPKQKAGCGVSAERRKRWAVCLHQRTEVVRRSGQAQHALNGSKESGLHLPHLLACGRPECQCIGAAGTHIADAQCTDGWKVWCARRMNEATDHVAVLSDAGESLVGLCVPAQASVVCHAQVLVLFDHSGHEATQVQAAVAAAGAAAGCLVELWLLLWLVLLLVVW